LPVETASFDLVHSRHVLEHFGRAECLDVLREWIRLLRPEGRLQLCLPNFLSAAKQIVAIEEELVEPDFYPWWQAYGAQTDHYDFHKNGFTPRRLESLLKATGLLDKVEVWEGDEGTNLYATAIKHNNANPPYALVSAWDRIMTAEAGTMSGLSPAPNGKPIEEMTPV